MSSSPFDSKTLIIQTLSATPYLLVVFAGVVLCLVLQSRPLRVRLAVAGALGLQLALRFVMPLFYTYLARLFPTNGGANNSHFVVMNVISATIGAVALALLLFAAFTQDDRVVETDRS